MIDPRNQVNQVMRMQENIRENQNRLAGRYDAGDIFTHLMNRVTQFENALGDDEEIGLQLANFGKAAEIHIREISFKNPNLIEFIGIDAAKNEVALIQHISQLNFLLISMKPVTDTPYRVGYVQQKGDGS